VQEGVALAGWGRPDLEDLGVPGAHDGGRDLAQGPATEGWEDVQAEAALVGLPGAGTQGTVPQPRLGVLLQGHAGAARVLPAAAVGVGELVPEGAVGPLGATSMALTYCPMMEGRGRLERPASYS
jgi:hypothetical protein